MSEQALALRWVEVPVPLPPEGRTRPFELLGERLLLCHAAGEPWVIENECPHMKVELGGASLAGTVLECPLHGGRLDVRDGAPAGRPIRRRARTFPVRRDGETIEVGLPVGA